MPAAYLSSALLQEPPGWLSYHQVPLASSFRAARDHLSEVPTRSCHPPALIPTSTLSLRIKLQQLATPSAASHTWALATLHPHCLQTPLPSRQSCGFGLLLVPCLNPFPSSQRLLTLCSLAGTALSTYPCMHVSPGEDIPSSH